MDQIPETLDFEHFEIFRFPIFHFVIQFQRALNHYSSIIFCADMTEKRFSKRVQNAQNTQDTKIPLKKFHFNANLILT